jgi:hypothetical protein
VDHKVTTFNNYDQREYDYDELEKKLLGNWGSDIYEGDSN